MGIEAIFRTIKAKIKDAINDGVVYPEGFYGNNARLYLTLTSSKPNSEEFANAMDEAWLFSRQSVNHLGELIKEIKQKSQGYQKESTLPIFSEAISEVESILDYEKTRLQNVKFFREKYYEFRKGEISLKDFLDSRKFFLSLPGEKR